MSQEDGSVTLQVLSLVRTQNWLTSTAGSRRRSLGEWLSDVRQHSGATLEITDDKGAIVRFTGDGEALLRVHEWATAHSSSARVLP